MSKRNTIAKVATPEVIADIKKAKAVLSDLDTISIKQWDTVGNHFAEIYSAGTEMALLTKDLRMVHPFVFCKDFMTDIFWAIANKRNTGIYGFNYNLNQELQPDMDKIRIVIRNEDFKASTIPGRVKAMQDFLNSAEKKLGFAGRSVVKLVTNPENEAVPTIYVESPKEWREDIPLKFSLYTMFVRMSFEAAKEGEEITDALKRIISEGKARDVCWSKPSLPLILDIFEKGFVQALADFAAKVKHKVYTKYTDVTSVRDAHHMVGPFATYTGTSGG